ncbi:MAG TPA: hypothetical protein PKD64_15345 [Pirellulaceae bacterium]|nr:hypothetical protein [Pirellulaceae bacterium]HMO93560.1 hypothetical protein [Pirellulaceae bacterium]HMP71109.1 hypothetical protein [Pirellulaceae bacterium]
MTKKDEGGRIKDDRAFGYVYSDIRYLEGSELLAEAILYPAGGELKQLANICQCWRSNEQLA